MEFLRQWRLSIRSFLLDLVRLRHPLSILYLLAINSLFCFVAFYTSREVQLRSLYALISSIIVVSFVFADHPHNPLLELFLWMFNDFLNVCVAFAVALCAFSVRELQEQRERQAFIASLCAVCAVVLAPAYTHRRINLRIAKFAAQLFRRLRLFLSVYIVRPMAVLWDWLKYIVLLRWLSVLVLCLNASLLSAWDWLDLQLFTPLRTVRHLVVRFFLYIVCFHWCTDLWFLLRRTVIDPTYVRLVHLLDGFIYIFGCYWLKPLLNRIGRACLDVVKFGLRMFGRASYASAALLYEHILCPLLIFCADRLEQLSLWIFRLAIQPLLAICYRRYKRIEDLALVYIIGPTLKRFLDLLPDNSVVKSNSDHELDAFMPELATESEGDDVLNGGDEAVQSKDNNRAMMVTGSARDTAGFEDEWGEDDGLDSRLSSFDNDQLFASGLKRIDITESDSEVDDFLPTTARRKQRKGMMRHAVVK